MRHLLLLSCVVLTGSTLLAQQPAAPAAPKPAPSQPAPAQPAPRRPTAAQTAARTGVVLMVTDSQGTPLPGVRIEVSGPTDRSGTTDTSGQLRVTGLRAGTYRLRFSGDTVITFEQEVSVRAGRTTDIDVTLNPAPPPPPPTPAPEPEPVTLPAPVGPAGEPLVQSVPDTIEQNFVGNQPRLETLLSCSGNMRTMLIQLNEPLPTRLYENADATYYVIGGEGTVTVGGQQSKVPVNTSVSVPRGTPHSFARQGRRALILMSVLAGEPCEVPK